MKSPAESERAYSWRRQKDGHSITTGILTESPKGLVVFLKAVFSACGDYEEERSGVMEIAGRRLMISWSRSG